MSLIEAVTERLRKRTDYGSHDPEVISLIRTKPFTWVAIVQYKTGTTSWTESVGFVITHDAATTPTTRAVSITDGDFHGDRAHVATLDRHDTRSDAQFIVEFLEAGRW